MLTKRGEEQKSGARGGEEKRKRRNKRNRKYIKGGMWGNREKERIKNRDMIGVFDDNIHFRKEKKIFVSFPPFISFLLPFLLLSFLPLPLRLVSILFYTPIPSTEPVTSLSLSPSFLLIFFLFTPFPLFLFFIFHFIILFLTSLLPPFPLLQLLSLFSLFLPPLPSLPHFIVSFSFFLPHLPSPSLSFSFLLLPPPLPFCCVPSLIPLPFSSFSSSFELLLFFLLLLLFHPPPPSFPHFPHPASYS